MFCFISEVYLHHTLHTHLVTSGLGVWIVQSEVRDEVRGNWIKFWEGSNLNRELFDVSVVKLEVKWRDIEVSEQSPAPLDWGGYYRGVENCTRLGSVQPAGL